MSAPQVKTTQSSVYPDNATSSCNRTFKFQRVIRFDIPTTISSQDINSSTVKNYLNPKNFLSKNSKPSNILTNTNNWIFLTKRSNINRVLIQVAYTLGILSIESNPHTAVYLCFQCPERGHISRLCPNHIRCANCSLEYIDKVCPNSSTCIKCLILNSRFGTTFNPAHKAVDSECPCYKLVYINGKYFLGIVFQMTSNYNSFDHQIVPAVKRDILALFPSIFLHGLFIMHSLNNCLL